MKNPQTSSGWLSPRFWLLSLVFWACFGLLQFWAVVRAFPGREELLKSWPMLLYALATPPLFECAYRLGRGRRSARGYYLGLLVAGLAPLPVMMVAYWLAYYRGVSFWDGANQLMIMSPSWMFHFVAVLGAGVAVNQYRFAQERQKQLLAAQLRALRSQLQPHFLFNTLQAISVTTKRDPDAAVSMLALLGDLLRQTLRERDGELVTMADEQELLRPYLELQQKRFADRLKVEVDVPAEVLGAAVPDMIMQPLVENALHHGIESLPGSGTVRIRARRQGDDLEIEVADDGAGPGDAGVADGIGLGTTRARLQALFGDRAELKLMPGGISGTVVVVRMPWQELASAA